MITLQISDSDASLAWAQRQVTAHHYLRAPIDVRCRPLAYLVKLEHPQILPQTVGCLIFGRPEATRCFVGSLTYGSQADVATGRARFDRWEVLNLARVWFSPHVQDGGTWCRPSLLPGFLDRRGLWRSTLASHVIGLALTRVGYDYLCRYPPVDCAYPYEIAVVLSYCDRRYHKGTIYRAAGFDLADEAPTRGIETWWTPAVAPLTATQDAHIRRLAEQSLRSRRMRAGRLVAGVVQESLDL